MYNLRSSSQADGPASDKQQPPPLGESRRTNRRPDDPREAPGTSSGSGSDSSVRRRRPVAAPSDQPSEAPGTSSGFGLRRRRQVASSDDPLEPPSTSSGTGRRRRRPVAPSDGDQPHQQREYADDHGHWSSHDAGMVTSATAGENGVLVDGRDTRDDNEFRAAAPLLLNGAATNGRAVATNGRAAADKELLELEQQPETMLLLAADGETLDVHVVPPRDGTAATPVPAAETACTIAWQVAIPFLIAGLGMVGAGLVLDIVQHWEVFRVVSEVFILVPALLGLKGNLEMTLASRLSTQANLGKMDDKAEMYQMIVGNLALVQCQAIVVGFLASLAAVIMGWIPNGVFDGKHALLLCASSLVTASVASFVLGAIMVGVVILSRKCNINPDNVATPIAASLGDLTTLSLLAGISTKLYSTQDDHVWLAPAIICVSLLFIPLWAAIAKRNPQTKQVLLTGWLPVITAMGISSLGGLILDFTVTSFKGIAVYQPVINGVGGNLVAVHASRISTSLHQSSELGTLPPHLERLCINPIKAFFGKDLNARTSRVLMLLVVPGHLIFTYTIFYVKAGHTSLTPVFVSVYLLAAVVQVTLLLYIAQILIHWMWAHEIDPDNSAIPYMTALGDLLGTALLAVAFHFLYLVGDKDNDLGD